MYPGRPNIGIRLVAMFLDYIFISILVGALLAVFRPDLLPRTGTVVQPKDDTTRFIYLGVVLLFMLKDSIGSRSIAKRLLGLYIIDHKGGYLARGVQCFVRNIPILVWPVEVLVVLFSPDRRLGDLMGGTRVVTGAYFQQRPEEDSLLQDSEPS